MSLRFLVLVRVPFLDGSDELGKLALVLTANLSDSEDSSSLLVNNSPQASLALDDGVRDTHLSAKSGKEYNQLNGVNIVGDEDQRRLLVFN